MTEQEIEELLGAYALDAVEPDERIEIETHLAECPRCRAEVAAHREVAALLANGGAVAPDGLWDRIAREISPELPATSTSSKNLIAQLPSRAKTSRRSNVMVGASIGIAAAIVLIVLLSVQVANLSSQVNSGGDASGMRAALNSVLVRQHRTIVLDSSDQKKNATVVLGANGEAFWVNSNLVRLPSSETYQVWAVVRHKTVVSIGIIGSNPNSISGFHLGQGAKQLMVTVEPEGGSTAPSHAALLSATV